MFGKLRVTVGAILAIVVPATATSGSADPWLPSAFQNIIFLRNRLPERWESVSGGVPGNLPPLQKDSSLLYPDSGNLVWNRERSGADLLLGIRPAGLDCLEAHPPSSTIGFHRTPFFLPDVEPVELWRPTVTTSFGQLWSRGRCFGEALMELVDDLRLSVALLLLDEDRRWPR